MKKELPLEQSPYDTYNSHRNLHSILMTSNDDNVSWYYNSFIQLNASKKLHTGVNVNFSIDSTHQPSLLKKCPLIDAFHIPYDLVERNDIIKFCIDSIDKGYYLYLTASQYYISQYYYYQKEYRFHDLFVYGYDTDERKLFARDFFSFKQVDALIDFDEFTRSYEEGKTFPFFTGGIYLIKKTDKFDWKFDINNYRYNLTVYLKCEPVVLYHYNYEAKHDYGYIDKTNYYFGLDCYITLENIVQEAIEFGCSIEVIPFHIVERHKLILLDSVKYIISKGYVNEKHAEKVLCDFEELHRKMNNVLNRILKYDMTSNVSVLKRVPTVLREILQYEEQAMCSLVNILESKSLTIIKTDGERRWLENKNLSYLDLYHEPDRYIRKVFFGRSIEVCSNIGIDQGRMKICIDGKEFGDVSLYSEKDEINTPMFKRDNLGDGCHILTIEPSDSGKEINVSKVTASEPSGQFSETVFEFVGIDTETRGNWLGRYGSYGYDIVGYDTNLPSDVFVMYRYYNNWRNNEIICDEAVESEREAALQTVEGDTRVTAHVYTQVSLSADITVTGDKPKIVALYFCDYQKRGYKQQVTIMNKATSEIVFSECVTNLDKGGYLQFQMLGSFIVTIKNVSELPSTDATLSAVFID